MRKIRDCLVLASTCMTLWMGNLNAQVLTCDAEAFKNYDAAQMSREYRAAFLKSIDRNKFEQIRSSSSGGGGANILGIGVSGGASYEDFNEKRQQELERIRYRQSSDEALNYVRNSFDGPGARAYNACIAGLIAQQQRRGLFMWLLDASEQAVTVKIHWRPTAGVTGRIDIARDVQLTGSSTPLQGFPTIWPADTEHQYILRRIPGQELRFVVNMGGDAASVILPPKPVIAGNTQPVCNSTQLVSGGASALTSKGQTSRLTDGNKGPEGWNSGAFAPQYIQIDFPSATWVHHIFLYPLQSPNGITRHQVIGTRSNGERVVLNDRSEQTANMVPFRVDFENTTGLNLRSLRVETISSPSWIAWAEIEVFACR